MTTQRFPIHVGRRSRLVLLLFGVRPSNAYVDLDDDELDAHFGFFGFRTPTSNLASWRIAGPVALDHRESASASASATTT